VPPLSSRPLVAADDGGTIPLPRVGTDFCEMCRRVTGGLMCLMIKLPQDWMEFSLRLRSKLDSTPHSAQKQSSEPTDGQQIDLPATSVLQEPSIGRTTCLVHFSSSQAYLGSFVETVGLTLHLRLIMVKRRAWLTFILGVWIVKALR